MSVRIYRSRAIILSSRDARVLYDYTGEIGSKQVRIHVRFAGYKAADWENREVGFLNQTPRDNLDMDFLPTVRYRQHTLHPVAHLKGGGWWIGRRADGEAWNRRDSNNIYLDGFGSYHKVTKTGDFCRNVSIDIGGDISYTSSFYNEGVFWYTFNGVYQRCTRVYAQLDQSYWNGSTFRHRYDRLSGNIYPLEYVLNTLVYEYPAEALARLAVKPYARAPWSYVKVDIIPPPDLPYFPIDVCRTVPVNWGVLCAQALESMPDSWQGNGVALVNDLRDCKSAAIKTAKSIRELPKSKLRSAASLYLSFHYGWKLLFSDLNELYASLKRNLGDGFDHCTASATDTVGGNGWDISRLSTYQIFYNRFSGLFSELDKFAQLSQAADLNLSLRSAWDLTKYSFIVDWFVDLESVLSSLDSFYTLAYHCETIAGGKSINCHGIFTDTTHGVLSYKYYLREYSGAIVTPTPPLATHSPTTAIRNHWIEGGSLIVSR